MGDMAIEMGRAQMAGPRGDSRYAELIQRINMCQDETNQVITNLTNKLELVRDLQEKSEGQAIPVAPDNPNRCALDSSLDDIYRETARIRRRLGVLLDEIMI